MSRVFEYMKAAIEQAHQALNHGEVPVGAVVVYQDKLIATSHNMSLTYCDPTAHAEIVAIRTAAILLQRHRLDECDLYVTLEPCAMCAQAIAIARIRRLYFGAYDTKGGGVDHGARIFDQHTCHHRPEIIGGLMEQSCRHILRNFFYDKR